MKHSPDLLPAGKLPNVLLDQLLRRFSVADPRLLVGPQMGVDAAVIDMGATCLVAKTDPITFATDAIGYYAVAVNSNDIATSGGMPKWLLVTVLLPEANTTEVLVSDLFGQLQDACAAIGVALVGGHTEVTGGLDRPILIGQMLGTVRRDKLGRVIGRIDADALVEVERCLAVFLGIAK